jgi:formylmethanofuran dehydrogenase subunit E
MDGCRRITLKEAISFHGHLGPYLVLGLLAGEMVLKQLGCQKYFGLQVKVWGANKRPKSCLIDGLQLSTGATYGKGNIYKLKGSIIKMEFRNRTKNRKITLRFKNNLIQRLRKTKTHTDSELLAKRLYKTAPEKIFKLTTNN